MLYMESTMNVVYDIYNGPFQEICKL